MDNIIHSGGGIIVMNDLLKDFSNLLKLMNDSGTFHV